MNRVKNQSRILIVDQDASRALATGSLLERDGEDLIICGSCEEDVLKTVGEAVASGAGVDVVLLSIQQRLTSEVVAELDSLWRLDPNVQVIVQAESDAPDLSSQLEVLEYPDSVVILRSPFAADVLQQLVRSLTGKSRWLRSMKQQLRTLQTNNVELQAELGESRYTENRLVHAATHDSLTGLPNREYIRQRIAECAIDRSARSTSAVMFLDVDNFKYVNDSLGHNIGDSLLVQFSKRLRAVEEFRSCNSPGQETLVARLGGDEFVILLKGLDTPEDAERIARALQQHLTEAYAIEGHDVRVGVSIGISFYGEGGEAPEQVMRNADMAMYRAKFGGKQCIAVYDDAMHRVAARRIAVENALRGALRNNEFTLSHQPIFSLSENQPVAVESLLRWSLSDGNAVSPEEFIPIAEETGLIVPIGQWVLQESLRTIARINKERSPEDRLSISVNVAQRQLLEPDFVKLVDQSLAENGLTGEVLNVEITEQVVLGASKRIRKTLEELRERGVRIFLDDFGTGHSSLTCLHEFPIDVVKIDCIFVSTMESNSDYESIVDAIVSLAHRLGASVIAEGVETQQHFQKLRELSCDWGQGYYFSRPLSRSALSELCGSSDNNLVSFEQNSRVPAGIVSHTSTVSNASETSH